MDPLRVLLLRLGAPGLLPPRVLPAAPPARAATGVGNSYTYIPSLQVVPITLSSIITYLYPAMVAVLATRFVRRLEGRRAWLALGISLAGVAVAVGGGAAGGGAPPWG